MTRCYLDTCIIIDKQSIPEQGFALRIIRSFTTVQTAVYQADDLSAASTDICSGNTDLSLSFTSKGNMTKLLASTCSITAEASTGTVSVLEVPLDCWRRSKRTSAITILIR
jgi:hypothetical protein